MPAKPARSISNGASSWLGLGSCILGAVAAFVWLPDSLWGYFLTSFPSKLFPPVFASAFAAGWVVGLWRLKTGQGEQEGAIRSHASITGILTALVAVYAAHAASSGPKGASLSFAVAAAFLALGLLPCALFATIGAGFAVRAKERRGNVALVASAILPVVAVSAWPVVYGVGKFLEKPTTTIVTAPVTPVSPEPPKPRYVKPEGFDTANAWKRIVVHEDVIPNVVEKSPFILSHDERRLAFVVREGNEFRLAIRQLYDSGPDRSLQLTGGVIALAWSPDDKRIIFLAADSGAFWVCEPDGSKMIALPIPVLDPKQRHALVWWRDEDVLVYRSRVEPDILSLDSLRLRSANEVPAWKALTEDERTRIGQASFTPAVTRTEKVKFSFVTGTGSDPLTLALNDDETLYARFVARGGRDLAGSFPNRDGSLFFIVESQRLRILRMGLRPSPSLRFVAEAREDFPASATVSDALAKRAIRTVVAAPIVNPLNGKTVAGNSALIKGYARVISASGKTCSVWIEQEQQTIREGDVLIALSAIQDGEEFSVSRDWWAVITKSDENQSIPRRADVPLLAPSPTRVLRPLPEPAPKSLATDSKASQRTISATGTQPGSQPKTLPQQQSAPNPMANLMAGSIPELSPKATDEDKVRHFIKVHHTKTTRDKLASYSADFGAIVDTSRGKSTSRAEIEQMRSNDIAGWDHITETVVEPIEVKRLTGNRFAVSYGMHFELNSATKGNHSGDTLIDVDVLLTSQGQKIVKLRTLPMRNKKP